MRSALLAAVLATVSPFALTSRTPRIGRGGEAGVVLYLRRLAHQQRTNAFVRSKSL
jgi:hypothetical protein